MVVILTQRQQDELAASAATWRADLAVFKVEAGKPNTDQGQLQTCVLVTIGLAVCDLLGVLAGTGQEEPAERADLGAMIGPTGMSPS